MGSKYPYPYMKVGEARHVPTNQNPGSSSSPAAATAARQYGKRSGKKFRVHKIPGEMRIYVVRVS